jgi:hypothetical protein
MADRPQPAELKLPNGVAQVRVVRWWWIDKVAGIWAADIEVDGHGLVSSVPGAWLARPVQTVPRGRRGRVLTERKETLGERFRPPS